MLKRFNRSLSTPNPYEYSTATELDWRMNTSGPGLSERFWYDQKGGGISGRTGPVVADRTRQLVFRHVDWMAFEDAESLPSAPIDLSFWSGALFSLSSHSLSRRYSAHPEKDLMWANPQVRWHLCQCTARRCKVYALGRQQWWANR